jgi:Archaeal/vacuolar-type H+-ATPase subunit E
VEIRELLEREARSKVKEIISEAEERASSILRSAEEEKERVLEGYKIRAQEGFLKEYNLAISKARQEATRMILQEQLEILKLAKEKAKEKLKETINDRETYKEVFKNLVDEAIRYMKRDVEVRVNPMDKGLIEEVLRELPSEWVMNPPQDFSVWDVDLKTWKVVEDDKVWAGALFVDKRRSFILNNDLLMRLDRAFNTMLEEFKGELGVEERV